MEEIETKSFHEQSSDESQRQPDEGESHQCVKSSDTFLKAPLFRNINLIFVYSGEDGQARVLPTQRAIETLAKGKAAS